MTKQTKGAFASPTFSAQSTREGREEQLAPQDGTQEKQLDRLNDVRQAGNTHRPAAKHNDICSTAKPLVPGVT